MADQNWALSVAEMTTGRSDAGFLFGSGVLMWAVWVLSTAAGHLLGSAMRPPPGHPIFFAALAVFVSILVPMWRGRRDALPWVVAAVVALLVAGRCRGRPGTSSPARWPAARRACSGRAGGAGMRLDGSVLLAILAMSAATYATRAGGYLVFRAIRPSERLRQFLGYVPGTLFVAYVVPALAAGRLPEWVGALATVAIMLRTGQMSAAILGGTAAAWAVWAWVWA